MATALRILTIVFLLGISGTNQADCAESFRISTLTIASGAAQHRFRVEIAETSRQRALGLQGRKAMAADQGMLFDFESVHPVTMWMKNTYLSLDMFFISENGTIINIARDTEPLSLGYINSAGPAKAVLEVRAGTARRLGIRAGDKVIHEMFENQ